MDYVPCTKVSWSEIDSESRPTPDVAPSPPLLSPLAALESVLLVQKEGNEHKRVLRKVTGDRLSMTVGVTCVMPVTLDFLERVARPLYRALLEDPVITKALILLPPESYHVTLCPLEWSIAHQMPRKAPAVLQSLAELQAALDGLLIAGRHSASLEFTVESCNQNMGSLDCAPVSAEQENLLRSLESFVV
eukprot:RCo012265